MSKNKDSKQPDVKQPDYVEELLKNGHVTLKAKTRDELTAMVNDISAEVKYGAGAVGHDMARGVFTLRIDLTSKE